MISPPRLATWLLERSLAARDRDTVVGDLCEEFATVVVPNRGVLRARCWYRAQVARSLPPLVYRSWQRTSLSRASTAVMVAALVSTLPAALLLTLRQFVLQQVPLKTTAELAIAFTAALAVVVLSAGAIGLAAAIHLLNADSGHG